jgi:hypothetical protein
LFKAGDIVADLHAAMARHGRPERMLTDIQAGTPVLMPIRDLNIRIITEHTGDLLLDPNRDYQPQARP